MERSWVTVTGAIFAVVSGIFGLALRLVEPELAQTLILAGLAIMGVGVGRKLDRVNNTLKANGKGGE